MTHHPSAVTSASETHPAVGLATDGAAAVDLERAVREVVVRALNLERESFEISDDANLFDLGADSMSIVDLFFQLEERFDVKFEETQINPEMFKRLGELVNFVRAQLGG